MKYDALALGEREMALGDDFVLKEMPKSGIPVVATNLDYEGKPAADPEFIIEREGIKIGVLGLTIDMTKIGQENWLIRDPFEAVKEALPRLRERVDLIVLLSHLGYRQSVALSDNFQGIDVILVGHQGQRVKTPIAVGGSILTQSGDKGKYLGRLDITFDRKERKVVDFKGELIALDPKIPDDEEMAKLYAEYQEKVKGMVKGEIEGRKGEDGVKTTEYMGAAWCRSCHAEQYKEWSNTPHAEAYFTLRRDGEEYNPECVGCHTTGYRKGGFVTVEETPTLVNVQCEACHGPSSTHVADKGKSPLVAQSSPVCQACHTGERGEGFVYEEMKGLVH